MTQANTEQSPSRRRGPLRAAVDLFSSIWLGVVLLSLLFVYSSIGSAYPPFRQMRIFEMTEYEWFHYWPFNLLIALICINLVVATIRRIPFRPLNYGVWMIHSGIIILALGSVWYFGTKIEGETLVDRRMVTLELDGAEPVTFAAQPGNSATIENDERSYDVRVSKIDPHWELLSGPDKGIRAYAVTLSIIPQEPGAEPSDEPFAPMLTDKPFFMRQLIAGFPQYTEDIVRTDDHAQPMKRVKKINPDGEPLFDEHIRASLSYSPERYTYLVNSSALYVREIGADGTPTTPWIERPIDNLPRYHDYVSDLDHIWLPGDDSELKPDPLSVTVPAASPDDPLAGASITITDYLRYAFMEQRRVKGGDELDPVVSLELSAHDGRSARYELSAFDPRSRSAEDGRLLFTWVDSESEVEAMRHRPGPRLSIEIPAADYEAVQPVEPVVMTDADPGFTAIGETGYSYRVDAVHDDLVINPTTTVSVAIVRVKTPDGEFTRFVYDEPDRNTDFPSDSDGMTGHEDPIALDESIHMTYLPDERPAMVTIIGGPDPDQLRLLRRTGQETPPLEPMDVGDTVELGGGVSLRLWRYAPYTTTATRPAIVPRAQRDRDAGQRRIFAMVRVNVPGAPGGGAFWLPFHLFAFNEADDAPRRFKYEPKRMALEDGRTIELMFARQRHELPAPVVLDDFVLTTHTGGFVSDASIRNWTSVVRFADEGAQWGEHREVSVNQPIEHGGYWYFQAQWDAPSPPRGPGDPGSPGLGFTVLGVGNRNGVNVMLFGTVVSVIGMIYAFYWKPILRRRRLLKVQTELAAHSVKPETSNGELAEGRTTAPAEDRPLEPLASTPTEQRS